MKNFKKILFSFILICTFFCFSKNVLADTTCAYTIDYPFETTQYLSNINAAYNPYLNYIYRKLLGLSVEDFHNYIEKIRLYPYGSPDYTPITKLDLTLHLNKNLDLQYVYSNGKVKAIKSVSFDISDKNSDMCPDVIAISIPDRVIHWRNQHSYYTYSSIANYYYLQNNDVDNLIVSIFNDKIWNDEAPLIFMNSDLKVATSGIMYVNYAYNMYFNDVHPNDNIDPIVEKYLAIDGTKEILDKLNEKLDKKNLSNSDVSGYAESISEFIKKIDVSLDTIGNDIIILNSFNSVEVTGVKGIYNILRNYLDGKGLTVSDWFSKYMPDSKAQYADSLASVLQYILDNPALYNNVKNNKNLSDTVSSCAGEDCDKEKICNEYVSSLASYECSEQTSISMAYNECYKSKAKNFDKLIKECKKNDIKKITKDIEDLNENIDKLVDETIASYYTRYFKGMGIDIGDNDFCGVLESGDIYEYIKLALNIIRIGGPILVILLTAYDGIKTISSFKDEDNKKFYNHLKVRLICLILLLLIPTIIQFIINLFVDKACNIEIYYK